MTSIQETLRAVIQMIHQAHHEGPPESCPKSTCSAARAELAEATEWTPFARCSTPVPMVGPEAEVWLNNRYQVIRMLLSAPGADRVWHLSVKRLDKEVMHDWRDLQRIKNELVGPEAEGVELYPADSRLVDTANQYHLWCFEDFRFPFGFDDRLVAEETIAGSKQRPFEVKPDGMRTRAQLEWDVKKALKRSRR